MRMHLGGPLPPAFASALCPQNASLPRADKSLIRASVHGSSGIVGIARQMRGLCGWMGGSGLQNMLYVAEGEESKRSSSED